MECFRCHSRDCSLGLLCGDCAEAIATSVTPQQIVALTTEQTEGGLLDQWGRLHVLGASSEIGRTVGSSGIKISDVSVSRQHAWISQTNGAWTVRDAGSSNGTYVNQEAVSERGLAHGDRISFGCVEFYVVFDVGLVATSAEPVVITCIGPVRPVGSERSRPRASSLRILEPTGGNGGVVEFANASAQLTATQLELFAFLCRRMRDDLQVPRAVRGFVRSSELVGRLSWDARTPDDTHVKQLVRRLRRTLVRSGLGDLIESRHRLGYRLRMIPHEECRSD